MSTALTSNREVGSLVPEDSDHPAEEREREIKERRRNYPSLLKYFHKLAESVEAVDRDERTRVRNAQVRAVAYYDGRQDGDVENGVWKDPEYVPGQILPKDNQFKVQIDKLLMEMARSSIEFETEPTDETPEWLEATRFFQSRIEALQALIESEGFVQSENMSLLLKLITFRYTFFDPTAKGDASEQLPKVERKSLAASEKMVVCRECGKEQERAGLPIEAPETERGQQSEDALLQEREAANDALDSAEAAPCPHCGSLESMEASVEESEGLDISYEEAPGGCVVCRHPDSSAVQLDMNARGITDSTFLRWRLTLRRHQWEAWFRDVKIPSNSSRSSEARYAEDFQGHASNAESWGMEGETTDSSDDMFEKIEGVLTWYDPVVYQDYRPPKDEQLPKGRTLQKDTPLIEMFPEGVCHVHIDKTTLDFYPSNKNKCWVMCVYGLREHALHGAGTLSMLGPQDTINDENAYIVANHYYNAAPREFIKSGSIEGNILPPINKVGIITNIGDGERIVGNVYDKSPPTSLSSDVYQFREAQRASMQEHAGTSSLSMQGAADAKALGTATGVEASRDQAIGRMIPNRKLYAQMVKEWVMQAVEIERENSTPEKFIKMAGQGSEKGEIKFTERGIRLFFESNLETDYKVKPVPGSVMMRTASQDTANATSFAQIVSQVQNEEMLSLMAPKFGIKFDVNEWGAVERAASARLREMARICSVITSSGFPASPEIAAAAVSQFPAWAEINEEMDNHLAFQDFYSDWWVSDEGQKASDLLRLVVRLTHEGHRAGISYQALKTAEAAAAAQPPPPPMPEPPDMQAQAAEAMEIQGAQAEQALAIQGAAQEQQLEGKRAAAEIDVQKKAAEKVIKES